MLNIKRWHEKCFQGLYVVEAASISHTPSSWSSKLFLYEGVNPVKYKQQPTQIICPGNFYLQLSQFTEDTEMSQNRRKYGLIDPYHFWWLPSAECPFINMSGKARLIRTIGQKVLLLLIRMEYINMDYCMMLLR